MTQDVGWAERSEPHQNAEKVALVTGSGKRRVGNVIAQALAARGLRRRACTTTARPTEARQSLVGLRAAGVRAEAFQADVADEASVAGMYRRDYEDLRAA